MTDHVNDSDESPANDGDLPTTRYDLIADVCLHHPSLPLSYTLRTAPQTTVHLHGWQFTQRPFQFFSAKGGDFAAFERGLLADPTAEEPHRVDFVGDRRIYRARLTDPKRPLARLVESGALVHDVRSRRDGWLIRMQLRNRDAFSEAAQRWRRDDLDVTVMKLATRDTVAQTSQFGLSEGQYDLLLMAFDAGYFDVPRRVSQTDLANRLDISPSAASTQIRRAVNRLIETTVASESAAAYWASREDAATGSGRWQD